MNKLGIILVSLVLVLLGCGESPDAQPDSSDSSRPKAGDSGTRGGSHEGDGGNASPQDASDSPLDAADTSLPPEGDAGLPPAPDAGTTDAGQPSALCLGDVVLETDEDVAAIAQCTAIGGSLTITGEGLTSVDLPLLEFIALNLTVESTPLRDFELPALELVGGSLYVDQNQLLERFALPTLTKVRGAVAIGGFTGGSDDYQPAMTAIELPALVEIGDESRERQGTGSSLYIVGNGGLRVIQLPALERIKNQVTIRNGDALTTIDLPALQWIGEDVSIGANAALAAVRMPALRECEGPILTIEGNSLTEVDLSVLRHAGSIFISSDADLNSVELPLLENAEILRIGPTTATRIALPMLRSLYGGLVIHDNSKLTSLELPLLADISPDWHSPQDIQSGSGILLENNAQLASVEFPALKLVGQDLLVRGNAMLASLNLSALEVLRNDMEIRDTALTELSAPVLGSVGGSAASGGANGQRYFFGSLTVADNPSLQGFALPMLATISLDFHVTNNALLPTCDAQAIAAQLSTPPVENVVIEGNLGTCP